MRMSKGHVAVNMGMYLFCIHFQIDTDAGGKRYIISVITITDIGEGKIIPSTGQAKFKTRYTAIVMKPFKGEVVDAKVVNVNKAGLAIVFFYTFRRLTVFGRWVSLRWSGHYKCLYLVM